MDSKISAKTRRERLLNAIKSAGDSTLNKWYVELLHLMLDQRVSLIIDAAGEEAVALRGEIRCIKRLLSVLEQGNTPFTDSI